MKLFLQSLLTLGSALRWGVWPAIPVALLALTTAASAAPVAVYDDMGHRVLLAHPARRIVSLAPHATEILFTAGAGPSVVGTVRHSDHPPRAAELPKVGDAMQIDIERIVALRPDLVVVWHSGNPARQVEMLRRLRIPIYQSEPRRLEDIPSSIERLGVLAGTGRQAVEAAQEQRRTLAALAQRYRDRSTVRAFYQIWNRPLYTLNGEHIVSEAMRLCGAENVFASMNALASTVTLESVLAKNPELILTSESGPGQWDPRRPREAKSASTASGKDLDIRKPGRSGPIPAQLQMWRPYPSLMASERGNLFAVDGERLHRPGPRLIAAIEPMCSQIQLARERRPRN